MSRLLILLAFLVCAAGNGLQARAQPDSQPAGVPDSYYYMMDDGEFSEEEMQKETSFIYQDCRMNILRKIYYDCECIAGAFLQQREKLGPMEPQQNILGTLFRGGGTECVNTPDIAGRNYRDCMEYTKYFRTEKSDALNESYCQCVANTVAQKFSRAPDLSMKYISAIRTDALVSCHRQQEP